MTSVSIALATYNGAQHLSEQLESYLAQTVLPDELVASDDGSTDDTVSVLEQFAKDAPFQVKVLQGKRLGFAQNFGRAMAATTGDIVFLSDQDDFWEPSKVERVLSTKSDLVVHDLMLCDESLMPSGQTMTDRLTLFGMGNGHHIKGCCSAVRRSLLELCLPIPDGVAHDSFLHALANLVGEREYLPEPLIRYRLHDTNTSTFALNSLTPVNRRLILRLRLRALGRQLGRVRPNADFEELARQRLEERAFKVDSSS